MYTHNMKLQKHNLKEVREVKRCRAKESERSVCQSTLQHQRQQMKTKKIIYCLLEIKATQISYMVIVLDFPFFSLWSEHFTKRIVHKV